MARSKAHAAAASSNNHKGMPSSSVRPLLLPNSPDDDTAASQSDAFPTTTATRSSSTLSSRQNSRQATTPPRNSNGRNRSRTPPRSSNGKPRRLRLFGGGGTYNKQANSSASAATSNSQPSRRLKYDTRSILPPPSVEQQQQQPALEEEAHAAVPPTVAKSATAIPVLNPNAKDTKHRVPRKADPPSSAEVVAAQQKLAQQKKLAAQQNAQQKLAAAQAAAAEKATRQKATTSTTPVGVSAVSKLKSVLRPKKNPKADVAEEKKTDEGQRPPRATTTGAAATRTADPLKALLSRPVGRATLPVQIGRNFVVEVSQAEWDADEDRWKYRILVQRRPNTAGGAAKVRGSFTTAYCWRSLADFGWLEQALRWEFHGALLGPLLNMAVGLSTISSTHTAVPVEAEALRNWLTDWLNGIRGRGEWLYLDSCSSESVAAASILQSEAMETFLYRTGPLTEDQLLNFTVFPGGRTWGNRDGREDSESLVQRVLHRSLEQLGPLTELCVGPMPESSSVNEAPLAYRQRQQRMGKASFMCSSSAIATAPSLDLVDSFGDASRYSLVPGGDHTVLLLFYLLRNYRETALSALEKLTLLRPAEEALGVAWKRMAIAMTNLFAYEKDVESAKLGDLRVKRENMPFRKVQKSHVDDGLRVMARHLIDRNEPALDAVKELLTALLADLSAVGPSVEAFREAQKHVEHMNTTWDDVSSRGSSSRRPRWLPKAQSLLPIQRSDTDESHATIFHQRFERNEGALQDALVQLCRNLPVRMARMAWRYWQTEISQVAELHKSAGALRSKISVTKEESVSRMLKRHLEEEKEEKAAEEKLIERMLRIGHKEDLSQEEQGVTNKREAAMAVAKERMGRWDIKLGLAIMEAIGIQDPNIRVEETTRDLRLVRKYAIGLRECLNRCVEAVGGVRAALSANVGSSRDLRHARQAWFSEMAQVFSGKIVGEDMRGAPWSTLDSTLQRRAGVSPTADPFHWSAVFRPEVQSSRNGLTQNSVGGLARECMDVKDKNTAWLLSCMSELLNDYQERVQQIESYVYMECVGIQLERHFSERRAAALAAFEKKTDITTAINVANKKKMPKLVDELQRKLDEIGNIVTHTTVREAKELHLESKQLKSDIHDLAVHRLVRARETSTERAVGLMTLWAKEEESSAAMELKALGEAIAALEKQVGDEDLDALMQGTGQATV